MMAAMMLVLAVPAFAQGPPPDAGGTGGNFKFLENGHFAGSGVGGFGGGSGVDRGGCGGGGGPTGQGGFGGAPNGGGSC